MTIERVLFTKQFLMRTLREHFPLAPLNCVLVSRSFKDTYKIYCDSNTFYLSIDNEIFNFHSYQHQKKFWRLISQIQCDHIVKPLHTYQGDVSLSITIADTSSLFTVFEEVISTSIILDDPFCFELGQALGLFHLQTEQLDVGFLETDLFALFEQSLNDLLLFANFDRDLHALAAKELAALANSFQRVHHRQLQQGLVHGDFFYNAIKNNASIKFIDFEYPQYHFHLYDIAHFYWCLSNWSDRWNVQLAGRREDLWEAFMNGYRANHAISFTSEELMLFLRLRTFFEMHIFLKRAKNFGIAWLNKNTLNQMLNYLNMLH